MRHRKSGKKLSRTWEHRKALFKNMARALMEHGKIRTTVTKAKELRKVADRLITLALRNDLHSRRLAFKVLCSHTLVKKLFDEIGPCFVGVPGGFTRVVSLGLPRRGDSAPLAFIELTRMPGVKVEEKSPAKKAASPVTAATAAASVVAPPAPAEAAAPEAASVPQEEPAAEGDAPPEDAPADQPKA
jgi:large subunit ribosomal protein L17